MGRLLRRDRWIKNPLPTNRQIRDVFDMFEEGEPDASTERLFAYVCDHFGGRIDNGDVASALAETELEGE